jgi:hypothetical protein
MTIALVTAQNDDPSSDTAVTRIKDTDDALNQTTTVTGYLVTLTFETWTVFIRSLVAMTRDLFDGLATEVRQVIGLTLDDCHEAGMCLGDPTACV